MLSGSALRRFFLAMLYGSRTADGRVFVCDREIDRIQILSPDCEFLEQWTDT
jgi:hypothetical protein